VSSNYYKDFDKFLKILTIFKFCPPKYYNPVQNSEPCPGFILVLSEFCPIENLLLLGEGSGISHHRKNAPLRIVVPDASGILYR
jgi:hypothetical protein